MLPQVAELMEKMESQRKELLDVLCSMSDKEAEQHPKGEWSAKQQIAHLVHAEPTWLDWAEAVQASPGATVGQTPDEGQIFLNDVADADSRSLAWWLERFQQVRQETVRRIEGEIDVSSEEALMRGGTHRSFGDMNVLQFLRAIYRHDRMHIDQLMGREQSFVPRQASERQ